MISEIIERFCLNGWFESLNENNIKFNKSKELVKFQKWWSITFRNYNKSRGIWVGTITTASQDDFNIKRGSILKRSGHEFIVVDEKIDLTNNTRKLLLVKYLHNWSQKHLKAKIIINEEINEYLVVKY